MDGINQLAISVGCGLVIVAVVILSRAFFYQRGRLLPRQEISASQSAKAAVPEALTSFALASLAWGPMLVAMSLLRACL
jgi:uncharacterized membrane protein